MAKSMAEALMNPARLRIGQYLAMHPGGTVSEIAAGLPDIPKPSVYRHMRVLLESGAIEVLGERTVRGTVERRYGLKRHEAAEYTREELGAMFQSSLMELCAAFARYFAGENPDPMRDRLGISSCFMRLSDEEYARLMTDISRLYAPYLENQTEEGRRLRRVTVISSPADIQEDGYEKV